MRMKTSIVYEGPSFGIYSGSLSGRKRRARQAVKVFTGEGVRPKGLRLFCQEEPVDISHDIVVAGSWA